MAEADLSASFCERLADACAGHRPVVIQGGGSKGFYGRPCDGEVLNVAKHSGVIEYEPSELVIRARSGTPLIDIEKLLDRHQQMLAFEPPQFSRESTLGGVVASGLSGPRRPFSGSVRDFVLGAGIINGKGEALNFGGQVMKNVAGYDMSRLMAGALGTLGLLTDVSLKVLPKPEMDYTLKQVCSQQEALRRFSDWSARPLPVSAACWHDDHLYLRLSGSETGVRHAQHQLGDTLLEHTPEWWQAVRNQQHEFFRRQEPLWRLSVPPATPPLSLEGEWLIDWAGAQRWLYTRQNSESIRHVARSVGGHATLFRHGDPDTDTFQPLPTTLFKLHQRLKQALDPNGILNPGRMYKDL